jgi:hypothetical protein
LEAGYQAPPVGIDATVSLDDDVRSRGLLSVLGHDETKLKSLGEAHTGLWVMMILPYEVYTTKLC